MRSLENIPVERACIGADAPAFSVEHVSLEMLREGAEACTFATASEFQENAIETREVLCRIYPSEFDVPVIVPDAYAAQLDEVRQLRREHEAATPSDNETAFRRWLDHPLCTRALPEDILAIVAALPTKNSLSQIILRDDANPFDVFFKKLYRDNEFRSAADVTRWGAVAFYRRDADYYLAGELFHEWVHSIPDRGAYRGLPYLFDCARAIEPDGDYSRNYASRPGEALAVNLGEQIMGCSGSQALEFAVRAPVRTAVLSRALRQLLQAGLEMLEPSSLMNQFISRLDVLDQETAPAARSRLIETAKGSSDRETAHRAALLLAFVGTAADVANLATEALDVSSLPVDAGVLNRIGCMTSLRRLDLSFTNLDGERLWDLKALPLEALAVSGLNLMNFNLNPLFHIKSLRSLDISGSLINDGGVETLSRMALLFLDTRRSRITDEGLQRLRDLMPEARIQ